LDIAFEAQQKAYHGGLMDKFVEYNGLRHDDYSFKMDYDPKQIMGYYDGNRVTALWSYAQRFAMSDKFCSSIFD
jgi:phospholipase C